MTLIEVMVYVVVVWMIIASAYSALWAGFDHSVRLRNNVNDIITCLKAGEQWRKDIRASVAEPVLEGNLLRLRGRKGEILYRFSGDKAERKSGQKWCVILKRVSESRMFRDRRKRVTAWRWEVEPKSGQQATLKPLFTFISVAGSEG